MNWLGECMRERRALGARILHMPAIEVVGKAPVESRQARKARAAAADDDDDGAGWLALLLAGAWFLS